MGYYNVFSTAFRIIATKLKSHLWNVISQSLLSSISASLCYPRGEGLVRLTLMNNSGWRRPRSRLDILGGTWPFLVKIANVSNDIIPIKLVQSKLDIYCTKLKLNHKSKGNKNIYKVRRWYRVIRICHS